MSYIPEAAQPDKSTFTEGTSQIAPIGGEYNTSPSSPSSGQAAAVQITQNRALHANLRNSSGTEIGTSSNPVRTDPTGTTTQPVSGTVGVSSLPSIPAGSNAIGSVSVSNLPTTQPVSGTVTANAGTGTFSNQQTNVTSDYDTSAGVQSVTMFGVALPASGGAVAGGTSNNPIRIDPTGTTTQPISGSVSVSNFPATQPVSASSLPLPTGAATAAKQPALGTAGSASADVISVQGIASMTPIKTDGSGVTQPVSGSVSVSNFPSTQAVSGTVTANAGTGTMNTSDANAQAQGSTTSGQKGFLELGAVATSSPSYTNGQTSPLSLTTAGALRVDASAATQPVELIPATSGGCSCLSTNATALTLIKSSAGQLYGIDIGNSGASGVYVQVFNASSTGSVTLGTTAPLYQTWIPAGGGRNYAFDQGIAFSTGLVFAVTTTRTGSTAPGTAADCNFIYK